MSDVAQHLPAPLTPEDCDLSDYEYMPMVISRLRKSRAWLVCKRKPELAFYMLNIWMAAWAETPAASIEDDDDVLADAACCPPEKWAELRDDVMRNFVKCSDGRLYHELIAIKALEAWLERLGSRISSGAGNAKKHGGTFDPTHLRERQAAARACLQALDPNSRYFTRRGAVAAPAAAPKPPAKSRARKGPSDQQPAGLPPGQQQEPRGVASYGTVSEAKVHVGGTPPTTPGAAAPLSDGAGAIPPAPPAPPQPPAPPAPAPAPTGKGVKPSIVYADRSMPLPEWLKPHEEAWRAFEEMRWAKHPRTPYTKGAQDRLVRQLQGLQSGGQNLTAVLDKSVRCGWLDVFPLKDHVTGGAGQPAAGGGRYAAGAAAIFGRDKSMEVIDADAR